ncbi:hypothetical protein PMN64_12505 [Bradyrhizobium sp. UFLA01-814]|uniref:hypothetical protein n=1 Tax=Bradyrhizobium sp. UFLA01-814 TaxID=3023480 RepID=UPI00398B964F
MDRARDLAIRLDKVEETLEELQGRENDEASIRKRHLTAIGEHLQSQLLEEIEWANEPQPEFKIKRKKKLRR